MMLRARLRAIGKKTIKQTKSRFNQKDPGQAEKQSKINKYNAKLIKYSPYMIKGAPEGGFGHLGAVLDQFGIVFAHF